MKHLLDRRIKHIILLMMKVHALSDVFYDAIGTMILGEKVMNRQTGFIPSRTHSQISNSFFCLTKDLSLDYPDIAEFLRIKVYGETVDRKRLRLMEEVLFLFYNYPKSKLANIIRETLNYIDRTTTNHWSFFVGKGPSQTAQAHAISCICVFGHQR